MKKMLIALSVVTLSFGSAIAQKEVKYTKIYYKDLKTENNDIVITVDNAVSTEAETKFKLRIDNKSADYIIYKPEESKFVIEGSDGVVKEKWKVIEPNDYGTIVVNLKGVGFNKVKNYTFELQGLYRVSANQNEFNVGNFKVTLNKLYKESDKTEVKFNAVYNGDKIAFIFPSKTAVKMPDGNDYANAKSKAPAIMLLRGENDSFTLKWDRMEGGKAMDMQKVEMFIKWNDAFCEVSPEKMKGATLNLDFDQIMSDSKGK